MKDLHGGDGGSGSMGHTIRSDDNGTMGRAIPSILRNTMGRRNLRNILHSTMDHSPMRPNTDCSMNSSKGYNMDCNMGCSVCSNTRMLRDCTDRSSIRNCFPDPISIRMDFLLRSPPCLLPSGHTESLPRSCQESLSCLFYHRKDISGIPWSGPGGRLSWTWLQSFLPCFGTTVRCCRCRLEILSHHRRMRIELSYRMKRAVRLLLKVVWKSFSLSFSLIIYNYFVSSRLVVRQCNKHTRRAEPSFFRHVTCHAGLPNNAIIANN